MCVFYFVFNFFYLTNLHFHLLVYSFSSNYNDGLDCLQTMIPSVSSFSSYLFNVCVIHGSHTTDNHSSLKLYRFPRVWSVLLQFMLQYYFPYQLVLQVLLMNQIIENWIWVPQPFRHLVGLVPYFDWCTKHTPSRNMKGIPLL